MAEHSRFDDADPIETREWLESIDSVLKTEGPERAHFLLDKMIDFARRSGAYLPYSPNTAYLNTIAVGQQPEYPGDRSIERRLESYLRWNAMAMVVQANRENSEYGGHIASYASSATLYEVGFNHFWRGNTEEQDGDLVFIQGHSSPGIYARAYLEGRLSEDQLNRFRMEVGGGGLSSYPHPWLMPEFWQFPTVSMGLGPMMAIYQARFMRYLENRELIPPTDRKVWCFLGDGETDEPESLGAITMPVREGLDNLVFVINCNLQRLDGPVRGNGKIIQELEAAFGGAGWNVLKVIWGSRWDPLLARDTQGLLRRVMEETVDGEYQNYKNKGGAYTRENFFGKFEELKALVANMSDEDIWRLNRGGHDPIKVYSAYEKAVNHKGQPTVILAKTVKGFGLGEAGGEGANITHQQKKLDTEALREFRDRFNIPVSDAELEDVPYCRPEKGSIEMEYLMDRRAKLGGSLPRRRVEAPKLEVPSLAVFKNQVQGSGEREQSTTMAFVRQFMELLAPCDDFTFEVLSKLSNVQAELALENHDFITVESSLIAYCALINAIACSGIDPHGNMTSTLKHAFRNMSDKQIDQDSETVLSQVQEALFQSLVQHPVAQNIIYSSEVALAAQNQSAELLRNNTICHASGNENCVADKSSHRVSPSASPRSVSFCL